MAIEKKCSNCGAKDICDIYKTYQGVYPCLKFAWFTPKEELVRKDEKKHWQEVRDKEVANAYRKGNSQAYFDLLMILQYETKGMFLNKNKLIKMLEKKVI